VAVRQVHTFSGGHVRHLERLVRADSPLRLRTLPVRFGIVEHAEGPIVVDTGYHPSLHQRLRGLGRVYPRVVPFTCTPDETVGARLHQLGYDADDVQGVFLTHLHADHVGGLCDVPGAPIWVSPVAWRALRSGSRLDLVRHGFFAELVPEDLLPRLRFVEPPPAGADLDDSALDLLGDGSLGVVSLPGHAPGQIGLSVRGPDGQRALFVGDATFSRGAVDTVQLPSPLFQALVADDAAATRHSLARIREWLGQHPDLAILAAHAWEGPDEGTLWG